MKVHLIPINKLYLKEILEFILDLKRFFRK
jgi:hypothetical protein